MGILPDLFPSILRQDACEIVKAPKLESSIRQEAWTRTGSAAHAKSMIKTSNTIELKPIEIDKTPRKDVIFAVHEKNVALARSSAQYVGIIDPRTYTDKTICLLLENLNSARIELNLTPLVLNPELCEHADFHAANTAEVPPQPHPGPAYKMIRARHLGMKKINTKVEHIIFTGRELLHGARHGTRLISAEGLGALACSELWLSGKYKKHVYPIRNEDDHAPDCACAEWAAYQVVMDSARQLVGVARDSFGRWVVEFLDAEVW